MKIVTVALFLLNCVMIENSFGLANYCHTKRTGEAPSVCAGRMIPASQARNLYSQDLKCSQNVHHRIREPQKFGFQEWSSYIRTQDRDGAQALRQKLPLIMWEGNIPYETIETWVWQSCDLVTSSFHCGSDTEYYSCTKSRTRCSGSGKNRSCSSESYSSTCSREVPRSCYIDVDHSESWKCSEENMKYSAEYVRPSKAEWNPKTQNYFDALPNKYDLLPGEIEDVQSMSNSGLSSRITPKVVVGGAWNEYGINISGDAVGATCRQNQDLSFHVRIGTNRRLTGKKTPNAFRMPVDVNGEKINPLEYDEDGTPKNLRLADSSSATMSLIAEQSRSGDLEGIVKGDEKDINVSQGKNEVTVKETAKNTDFFKNTKVKITLVKKNSRFYPDTINTRPILGEDGDFVEQSLNAYAQDEDVALADYWNIPLDGGLNNKGPNLYLRKHRDSMRSLKPGQDYYINVSMYQKGARGLYLQDCSEDPNAWQCKWYSYLIFKHRNQDTVFSDPISIPFVMKNGADKRDFVDKFWDFLK
jgi:hypothetical protein